MSGVLNRTVVWVTLRQLFVRARLVTAIIVAVVPFVIVVIFQAGPARGAMANGQFLVNLYREFVIGTLLPLMAVVFGTTAFGAEVADGTIVYLLVKPEARWRVVLSKYAIAVLATTLVMVPAVVLPWLRVDHAVVPASVPVDFAAAVAIGAALYGSLFVPLGLTSRRALVGGLLYIVLVEFILSRNTAGVMSFSIREYVLTTLGVIGEGNRWISAGTVTMNTVWTMGSLLIVGGFAFAVNKLRTFEMAEKL